MRKELTKSSTNVVFTGTLGGIAEWLGIDPTIVRVIYVIFSCFSVGFPGILVYIILSVIIPSGKYSKHYNQTNYNRNAKKTNPYAQTKNDRKNAEKIDDDDWSDF